jgi:hypothetical protein
VGLAQPPENKATPRPLDVKADVLHARNRLGITQAYGCTHVGFVSVPLTISESEPTAFSASAQFVNVVVPPWPPAIDVLGMPGKPPAEVRSVRGRAGLLVVSAEFASRHSRVVPLVPSGEVRIGGARGIVP